MENQALVRLEALRRTHVPSSLGLESRMHGNVPVRFGKGRLDSLGHEGLAAYFIAGAPADQHDARLRPGRRQEGRRRHRRQRVTS